MDWLANGVNHSHPDFGGPGCYTFRSSAQWVRMSTSTCIRMKYVHMQCYVPVFFLGWRDHCSTCLDPPPRRLGSQQAFSNSSTNCRAHKSFRVAPGWLGIHHFPLQRNSTPSLSLSFYNFSPPSLLLFHFINPSTETPPVFPSISGLLLSSTEMKQGES